MNKEVIAKLRRVLDPSRVIEDETELLVYECDGLPLFKISETQNVARAGIAVKSENAVNIWQDAGTSVNQFRVLNVDQMMAFDCGEFELK